MQLQHFALSEMTQNLSNNIKIKYQNGVNIGGKIHIYFGMKT
jgi:hypothetical protein